MASKKTIANRLFSMSKISTHPLKHRRISPDSGHNGLFLRFLSKKEAFQLAASPEIRHFPIGGNVMEKLKSVGIGRDRILLDGLSSPVAVPVRSDARKLLRSARLESVKLKLRGIQKSWITYSEFVRICGEGYSDPGQDVGFAKMLDESGDVIVFGNVVILKPEQVNRAIKNVILISESTDPNNPRIKELEEMEKQKAEIDEKAKTLAWRELRWGLGFIVCQTVAFMRLTFWDLSWDVMEPICFYVTSTYFIAGYIFFLRTSKEPSYEGFFQSRFSSKQKRLMKLHNFDILKYNELRRACYHLFSSTCSDHVSSGSLLSDC